MIYTTLNKIRAYDPCAWGWKKLLAHLGKTQADDEPLPLVTVLDSNGLDDCLWCLKTMPEHAREWRLYAVWCARQVQHLMGDQRSIDALEVAERHAQGLVSDDDLQSARTAAWAAAMAAARASAWNAAGGAAWNAAVASAMAAAVASAMAAAVAATWDVAWDAAGGAARDAAVAAAWDVAWDASGGAAWNAARAAQEAELRRIIC